jgi:hypothetical protein
MIQHHERQLDEAVAQAYEELPERPGRRLKAYVLGSLSGAFRRDPTTAALMAAVIHDPELLAPSRAAYREALNQLLDDGTDPALAMIVMSAVDGLMFDEFLQAAPQTAKERSELIERLLQLAETGSALPSAPPRKLTRNKPAKN